MFNIGQGSLEDTWKGILSAFEQKLEKQRKFNNHEIILLESLQRNSNFNLFITILIQHSTQQGWDICLGKWEPVKAISKPIRD